MSKATINRFHYLTSALFYTNSESEMGDYFTVWERMMINQERAYLLNNITLHSPAIRFFKVSEKLESKIVYLLRKYSSD